MYFEIIFSLASLFGVVRLGALARLCIIDKNISGAVMLIVFAVVLTAFSAYQFI